MLDVESWMLNVLNSRAATWPRACFMRRWWKNDLSRSALPVSSNVTVFSRCRSASTPSATIILQHDNALSAEVSEARTSA